MAVVISFREGARTIRRRRQQDLTSRCAEVIELNLRLALELYAAAPTEHRHLRAEHVRHLAELLEHLNR